MNIKLKIAIVFIFLLHLSIAIARKSTTGVAHHRLVRLHTIFITSTVMLVTSFYIWKRVNLSITYVSNYFATLQNFPSEPFSQVQTQLETDVSDCYASKMLLKPSCCSFSSYRTLHCSSFTSYLVSVYIAFKSP